MSNLSEKEMIYPYKRSGKTYNKIQEMAEEIDRLQKELDKEKGYHSELQLRYNIEHDKYLKLKKELEYYKEKEQAEIDDFENRDRWE